ncbi:MAG: transposase [Rickettsia endosymbiont of Argas persicus]
MMYLDCIYVKARDNHVIINKAVYLSVGVNLEGKRAFRHLDRQK